MALVGVFGVTLTSRTAAAASTAPAKSPATGQTEGSPGASAAGAVAANAFLQSLTREERAWLHEHPVIRVAQDPSWSPVEFADERGAPSGMTGDYLKLIEQRLGLKFEWVLNLSWQEAYARMKRWEIDMTPSLARVAGGRGV